MCFSQKLLMERILLLVVMPALLLAAPESSPNSTIPSTSLPVNMSSSPANISCVDRNTTQPTNTPDPPILARVKVEWDKKNPCHGRMFLVVNFTTSKPLCVQNKILTQKLHNELCEERRCGKFQKSKTSKPEDGYIIAENRTVMSVSCETTTLTCRDIIEKNNELLAYKAVTGLLLALVLAVILFRFAWPTYRAVRKRFSQKQQNRWIGPTQSQSVSYHRGKSGQLTNDTGKRHSYPGLERLSVNPSREPSSNRNSDYDSYGYN